jgi:hypothetical protein
MSAENRAYERSDAGTGPTPIYQPKTKDVINGWRRETPPIAKEEDE